MTGLLLNSAPAAADQLELVPGGDQALVVHGEHALVPTEARLEKLRRDREVHSYKQIWTKDAHGGPYRKAAVKTYDPLLQLPDGTEKQVELGYERVERGPTTNFVGNHMTQGAIDLVQAELERPAAAAAGTPPPGLEKCARPMLHPLARSFSAEACSLGTQPPAAPLQQYTWWDGGAEVCVRLDLAGCRKQLASLAGGRATGVVQLCCSFGTRSLRLHLAHAASPGAAAGDDNTNVAPAVQLLLDPLCQAILPAACSAAASGLQALCARAIANTGSSSPAARAHTLPAVAAAASGEELHPVVPTEASSGDAPVAVSLSLGAGATAVVVRLRKADPSVEWGSLQGSAASTLAQRLPQQQPDLAALRRSVRQRRQGPPAAGSGGSILPAEVVQGTAAPAPQAGTREGVRPSWEELLNSARHSLGMGQYQAAIDACTALLQQPAAPASQGAPAALVEALSVRAACHGHMGGLKQAIEDYSAALELCTQQPAAASTAEPMRLLLARASAREQLEQYAAALEDLRRVAAQQLPAVDQQVALSIQRVARSLREAERVLAQLRSVGGDAGMVQPPSVPRQSQLFSNRPKGLRI